MKTGNPYVDAALSLPGVNQIALPVATTVMLYRAGRDTYRRWRREQRRQARWEIQRRRDRVNADAVGRGMPSRSRRSIPIREIMNPFDSYLGRSLPMVARAGPKNYKAVMKAIAEENRVSGGANSRVFKLRKHKGKKHKSFKKKRADRFKKRIRKIVSKAIKKYRLIHDTRSGNTGYIQAPVGSIGWYGGPFTGPQIVTDYMQYTKMAMFQGAGAGAATVEIQTDPNDIYSTALFNRIWKFHIDYNVQFKLNSATGAKLTIYQLEALKDNSYQPVTDLSNRYGEAYTQDQPGNTSLLNAAPVQQYYQQPWLYFNNCGFRSACWKIISKEEVMLEPGSEYRYFAKSTCSINPAKWGDQNKQSYVKGMKIFCCRLQGVPEHDSVNKTNVSISPAQVDYLATYHLRVYSQKDADLDRIKFVGTTNMQAIATGVAASLGSIVNPT